MKMQILCPLFGAAAFAALLTPASAAPPVRPEPVSAAAPVTADVHCYIIFLQMGSSDNATIRTAGTIGGLYYMGRLDGRDAPGTDLEKLIMAEMPKLTGNLFATEASRCGDEMKARGASASAMGEDMAQKEAALMDSK